MDSGETETSPHTPKKKLSIEVANIDCVHINDMYIFETRKRQVRKDLTPQTTRADDKDLALAP